MMTLLDELPLWLRTTLRVYPWRRVDPVPRAPLRRPIEESRVALVTTAGLVAAGQSPFDAGIRGGDCSYRIIPAGVDVPTLGEFHRSESFDHAGILEDRNVAFPLDRLRLLAGEGVIGEVAPRHLSFRSFRDLRGYSARIGCGNFGYRETSATGWIEDRAA